VDEAAIRNYIGEIEQVLSGGSPPKAFLVNAKQAPPIDPQLPIWELPSSSVFFSGVRFGFIPPSADIGKLTRRRFPKKTSMANLEPRNEPPNGSAEGLCVRTNYTNLQGLQFKQRFLRRLGSDSA
jgi:hypothetical protein